MKTVAFKHASFGLALALALLPSAQAVAAGPDNYEFEAIGQPSDETLTVRLIDLTTGLPVTEIHVFAFHRQQMPFKGESRFFDQRIALDSEGKGHFTCASHDVQTGVNIRLVAQIDANSPEVTGGFRVGGCPGSAR